MEDDFDRAFKAEMDWFQHAMSAQMTVPDEEHVRVSKILRCHLIVEQALRDFVAFFNPNLGVLESDSWGFDAVRKLAAGMHGEAAMDANLNADLKNLNTLRNKLAHRTGTLVDLWPVYSELHRRAIALCDGKTFPGDPVLVTVFTVAKRIVTQLKAHVFEAKHRAELEEAIENAYRELSERGSKIIESLMEYNERLAAALLREHAAYA